MSDPSASNDPGDDVRLYTTDIEGCEIHIKHGSERAYCYMKSEGQEYFHLIVNGEIYVQRGHEKYCLNCARKARLLTTDRLFWQHGG